MNSSIESLSTPDGPIFENVFTGSQVNLWKFLTPRWHEDDGGRYLGTRCVVIMRDPETTGGCSRKSWPRKGYGA